VTWEPLGSPEPVYLSSRQERKLVVFHIMYGWHAGTTETEVAEWRQMAAEFVNGRRDEVPLCLDAFRALKRWEAEQADPYVESGPSCHGMAYDDACAQCVDYWRD